MRDPRQALVGTLALLAATVAALFALALGDGADTPSIGGDSSGSGGGPAALGADQLLELGERLTPPVARRIEAIRDLEFKRVPTPQTSSVAQLDRKTERQLAKPGTQRDLAVAEAELRLLGLLEPERGLNDLSGEINELIAGYYDPRSEEFFLVSDSAPMGPGLAEITLAHELTHALEDQRFELPDSRGLSDDRMLAGSALVEGTATSVMVEYADRYLDLFALAAESFEIDASTTTELPRFAESEIEFTYGAGAEFVDELRRLGEGWALVDYAWQRRRPQTTEQVLHPAKYLRTEPALRVAPPPSPGPDWTPLDSGTLGEFGTREVLRAGERGLGADLGADGWGGDAYRLFRLRGSGPDCADACRSTHALGVAWRGDDPGEARELARALDGYAREALAGDPGPRRTWHLSDGWAAVYQAGDRVGLGLAPGRGLALRLARVG